MLMNILKNKAIYAEIGKGKWIHFKQEKMGLFVCDVRKGLVDFSFKSNSLSYKLHSLLQTVTRMKNYFTMEEINLAKKVKSLCQRLSTPLLRKFSRQLNKGFLTHTNVTSKDTRRSKLIHGKEVVKLRGKATRLSQASGETLVVIEIPRELINAHKNARLFVDVIYVNKIPFLHTISENVVYHPS